MRFIRVAPSIMCINYNDEVILAETVKLLERSGANMIHFDIMDGKFVPNKTFNEKVVDFVSKQTRLINDVHLMVQHPELHYQKYITAGADIITIHYETCSFDKMIEMFKKIKDKNILTGVAINPETPVLKLKDILKTGLVDMVTVMGVNPGRYGQPFIAGTSEKIAEVRDLNKDVYIEVDGGVTVKNSKMLRKLGANIIVSGSTIFNSKNIKRTISQLKGRPNLFGKSKDEDE